MKHYSGKNTEKAIFWENNTTFKVFSFPLVPSMTKKGFLGYVHWSLLLCIPSSLWDRAVRLARRAHAPKVNGSNPFPAILSSIKKTNKCEL